MRDKIKQFYKRISEKVFGHPVYVAALRFRDKLCGAILVHLLTFFDFISPVCTFFCVKKPNHNKKTETSNEISQKVTSN